MVFLVTPNPFKDHIHNWELYNITKLMKFLLECDAHFGNKGWLGGEQVDKGDGAQQEHEQEQFPHVPFPVDAACSQPTTACHAHPSKFKEFFQNLQLEPAKRISPFLYKKKKSQQWILGFIKQYLRTKANGQTISNQ